MFLNKGAFMKIIRWDPFGKNNLFDDDFFKIPFHSIKSIGCDLAVDVYEKNNTVFVQMQVPGIDADKIDISVQDTTLHVKGTRDEERETEDKDYYSKEIKRGSFERLIELPCAVMPEKTSAECKDGILRIALPKKVLANNEKIKIAVNKK